MIDSQNLCTDCKSTPEALPDRATTPREDNRREEGNAAEQQDRKCTGAVWHGVGNTQEASPAVDKVVLNRLSRVPSCPIVCFELKHDISSMTHFVQLHADE